MNHRPLDHCRRQSMIALFFTGFILAVCNKTFASVGLIFTDNDSTPNQTTASPGGVFPFSVKLSETLTSEQISGVDYQILASTSGVFEFLHRNSQAAGNAFSSPNGQSDSQLLPIVLNPSNGTDLGTSTGSGLGIAGPGTFEVSDFSFEVLPGTPAGIYTLSFAATSDSGPPPNYSTGSFNSLGTFAVTVSVPEPVSVAGVAACILMLSFRVEVQAKQ